MAKAVDPEAIDQLCFAADEVIAQAVGSQATSTQQLIYAALKAGAEVRVVFSPRTGMVVALMHRSGKSDILFSASRASDDDEEADEEIGPDAALTSHQYHRW